MNRMNVYNTMANDRFCEIAVEPMIETTNGSDRTIPKATIMLPIVRKISFLTIDKITNPIETDKRESLKTNIWLLPEIFERTMIAVMMPINP